MKVFEASQRIKGNERNEKRKSFFIDSENKLKENPLWFVFLCWIHIRQETSRMFVELFMMQGSNFSNSKFLGYNRYRLLPKHFMCLGVKNTSSERKKGRKIHKSNNNRKHFCCRFSHIVKYMQQIFVFFALWNFLHMSIGRTMIYNDLGVSCLEVNWVLLFSAFQCLCVHDK